MFCQYRATVSLAPTSGLIARNSNLLDRISCSILRSGHDRVVGLRRSFSCLTTDIFHNACVKGNIVTSKGNEFHWPAFGIAECRRKNKPLLCSFDSKYGTAQLFSTTTIAGQNEAQKKKDFKIGPGLEYFIAKSSGTTQNEKVFSKRDLEKLSHPYVDVADIQGHGRKVYFDVYGCQMNVNDTEVAWSILQAHGYQRTNNIREADVVLVMTCSIREGAEQKIWNKLDYLRGLKNKRLANKKATPMKIGILGCMAERLKKKLVEKEKSIDVVVGPDSYRDLPRLLAIVESGELCHYVLACYLGYFKIVRNYYLDFVLLLL